MREATIELRRPVDLRGSLWSHPMLGEPTVVTGAAANERVLVWKVKDRPVRRLESGVPKMDRNVGVSFSTATWDDVSRGLREGVASLEAESPEVTRWAREAAHGLAPSRELVESVVAASGKAVMDPVHYVFPRSFVTTLSATYATQANRDSALAVNRATLYHVRRRVELPAKARILRLPGPFDGKGPLVSASRRISVAGSSIEEDFTLDVTTGTVARGEYDAFVGAAHRADDAFRASTRVKPPAP